MLPLPKKEQPRELPAQSGNESLNQKIQTPQTFENSSAKNEGKLVEDLLNAKATKINPVPLISGSQKQKPILQNPMVSEGKKPEPKPTANQKPLSFEIDDKIPEASVKKPIADQKPQALIAYASPAKPPVKNPAKIKTVAPKSVPVKIVKSFSDNKPKATKPEPVLTSKEIKPISKPVNKPESIEPALGATTKNKMAINENAKPIPVEKKVTKVAAAAPKIDLTKIRIWEAEEGAKLKKTLTKWCEKSGVTLEWKTKQRPDLEMDMYINATLENALKTLFSMGVKEGPQYTLDAQKAVLTVSD